MKVFRFLVVGIVSAVLAGCALSSAGMVDLETVPYSFHPPAGLETKLSVEPMTGQWADEVFASGVESAAFVTYTPDVGEPTTLMGVYYMLESVFDAAANPNEPPVYGTEVARADGKVLSVAGPQESIYDPVTDDGKNIGLLFDSLYDPESYMAK